MTSMVLMDLTLKTVTLSVNVPLVSQLVLV
jgi:hypothetical protein